MSSLGRMAHRHLEAELRKGGLADHVQTVTHLQSRREESFSWNPFMVHGRPILRCGSCIFLYERAHQSVLSCYDEIC